MTAVMTATMATVMTAVITGSLSPTLQHQTGLRLPYNWVIDHLVSHLVGCHIFSKTLLQ